MSKALDRSINIPTATSLLSIAEEIELKDIQLNDVYENQIGYRKVSYI